MPKQMDNDIKYLKGVGEKRGGLYKKLAVNTVGDLIEYYPRAYLDLSRPVAISEAQLNPDANMAVKAMVVSKTGEQRIRKGLSIFKVVAVDEDEAPFSITFYNVKYTVDSLNVGEYYIFYGKVGGTFTKKEMNSPQVFSTENTSGLLPIYPQTNGLTSKLIAKNVRDALSLISENIPDPIPAFLRTEEQLCTLSYALEKIHFPQNSLEVNIAKERLVFEELFFLSLAFKTLKINNRTEGGQLYSIFEEEKFYSSLPFAPTGAQKRAVADIIHDLKTKRMNRIVEGDVGSGKTMVAGAAAYFCALNGGQCVMMAPTEILAEQHYESMGKMLEPFGITTLILTGSMTAKQKREAKAKLASGEVMFAVGTHALITDDVRFKNLSLVITDEQHRFGVGQRTALSKKGEAPHMLVMSATPIPRTLSLIIYGDLELSVLDEMPARRQPIKTYVIDSAKKLRAYGFIKEHLDKGMQGYIVCPLVEDSEMLPGLVSATEYSEELAKGVFQNYSVGLLHGKMKGREKEEIMRCFKNGEIQLLVSTTVIEVGVDVPNAAVMLIENAERFGLSALHQLRGRIGRGDVQSHCILVSDSKGENATTRLKTLASCSSGFEIAEKDLAMRGPGDFFGFRQHGLPALKIADMASDVLTLSKAQAAAEHLVANKTLLSSDERKLINRKLNEFFDKIGEKPN